MMPLSTPTHAKHQTDECNYPVDGSNEKQHQNVRPELVESEPCYPRGKVDIVEISEGLDHLPEVDLGKPGTG